MSKTLNQRASEAARRFLEARDYLVVKELDRGGTPFIVADDGGELVIARVACGTDRVPEPWRDRGEFEDVAASYLRENEVVDVVVRGDSLDILVIGGSRGLLRHSVNCTGSFMGA